MHQIKCANSGGCMVITVLVFCRIMDVNPTWNLATADIFNLTATLTGYGWEGGK
jgi:hypothetical protein